MSARAAHSTGKDASQGSPNRERAVKSSEEKTKRRHFARFSPGIFVCAFACVVFYVLALFVSGWMYLLGALSVALLVMGVVLPILSLRALGAERLMPQRGVAGKPLGVYLTVRNLGRLSRALVLAEDSLVDNAEALPGANRARWLLKRVGAGGRHTVRHVIRRPRRGVYGRAELRLLTAAPFGVLLAGQRKGDAATHVASDAEHALKNDRDGSFDGVPEGECLVVPPAFDASAVLSDIERSRTGGREADDGGESGLTLDVPLSTSKDADKFSADASSPPSGKETMNRPSSTSDARKTETPASAPPRGSSSSPALRPYRPGESARGIAWRASARSLAGQGSPVVRRPPVGTLPNAQTNWSGTGTLTVNLPLRREWPEHVYEGCLWAACSLCLSIVAAGLSVRVMVPYEVSHRLAGRVPASTGATGDERERLLSFFALLPTSDEGGEGRPEQRDYAEAFASPGADERSDVSVDVVPALGVESDHLLGDGRRKSGHPFSVNDGGLSTTLLIGRGCAPMSAAESMHLPDDGRLSGDEDWASESALRAVLSETRAVSWRDS